jgi:HD-like signal output (HDOD) protein
MKIRLLIIGNVANILNPLRKMLLPEKGDWDIFFAVNADEVVLVLNNHNVDMVIADMHIPDNEGIKILEMIKESFPSIIRIVISDPSERALMLKSSEYAHQFLAKPDNAIELKRKISKIYSLQTYLHNQEIAKFVNGIKDLPGLPELYLKIEEETNKVNPSLKKIEEYISKDIIMTVKILQLVNSAFFGLPAKVISPLQAINFLGLGTIKSLVLMVHLFTSDDASPLVNYNVNKLWEHSLKIAKIAKMIASKETNEPKFIEETYIGGLLHDIGKIVLWKHKGYFHDIERLENEYSITTTEAEYMLYQTSHAEVGAYLMGIWGLPESLIEIVCYHHHPSNSNPMAFSPLTIIHIADNIFSTGSLDLQYIETLKISDKVNYWKDYFSKENQSGIIVEQKI